MPPMMNSVKVAAMPPAANPKDAPAPVNVERLEIEKTDNGGFVVTVFKAPEQGSENGDALGFTRPTKHSFSGAEEMASYVMDAFGGGVSEEKAEPEPEVNEPTPAPMAAPEGE